MDWTGRTPGRGCAGSPDHSRCQSSTRPCPCGWGARHGRGTMEEGGAGAHGPTVAPDVPGGQHVSTRAVRLTQGAAPAGGPSPPVPSESARPRAPAVGRDPRAAGGPPSPALQVAGALLTIEPGGRRPAVPPPCVPSRPPPTGRGGSHRPPVDAHPRVVRPPHQLFWRALATPPTSLPPPPPAKQAMRHSTFRHPPILAPLHPPLEEAEAPATQHLGQRHPPKP